MIRPFHAFVPAKSAFLASLETLLVAAALAASCFLMLGFDAAWPPVIEFLLLDKGLARIAVAAAAVTFGLFVVDLYTDTLVRSRIWLAQQLSSALGIAFLIEAVIAYLVPAVRIPVRIMLPGGLLGIALVFACRLLLASYSLRISPFYRVLLIGSSPHAQSVAAYVERHPEMGMQIAGRLRQPAGDLAVDAFRGAVDAVQPNRVIVGCPERMDWTLAAELLQCRFSGCVVESAEQSYENLLGLVSLDSVCARPMEYAEDLAPHPDRLLIQRAFSLPVTMLAFACSLPALALAAGLARLAFSGAVLERRTMLGFAGGEFSLLRFRSNPESARVPWIARLLRRLRLAGLPALFNIIKGDLALVGPSPEPPVDALAFSGAMPSHRYRLNVLPGLTGWTQVRLRSDDALRQNPRLRLESDLYYVKYASLSLDIFILMRALKMFFAPPA